MGNTSIDEVVIFCADSPAEPLHFLKNEYKETDKIFEEKNREGTINARIKLLSQRKDVIDYLIKGRESIIAFQYSGHADKHEFIFEGDVINPDGIVKLLAKCPKLKLIILNGCGTHHQLKLILKADFPQDPVIISTSSAVEDESASIYGITFWAAMCQHNSSIEEAHQLALAAIQTYPRNQWNARVFTPTRNIGFENDIDPQLGLWDLTSESDISKEWKLPRAYKIGISTTNTILSKKLLDAYSKYHPKLKSAEIQQLNDPDQITLVLSALPLPISEQLRKLFARRSVMDIDDGHVFYDVPGLNRLQQIIFAYQTLMETIAFIHLAQFWEEFSAGKIKKWQKGVLELKTYFLKKQKNDSLCNLVFSINKIFTINGIDNFLTEWNQVSPRIDEQNIKFNNAVEGLQKIISRIKRISAYEARELCEIAEVHLAEVYASLSFIINYEMASVKAIHVNKYRHLQNEKYRHNLIRLKQDFNKFDRVLERMSKDWDQARYTDTVFIAKGEDGPFLNLTPFVIDENSYNPLAPIAKIRHFFAFERLQSGKLKCAFTHVYNRNENFLELKSNDNFQMLLAQLNYFYSDILKISDSNEKPI